MGQANRRYMARQGQEGRIHVTQYWSPDEVLMQHPLASLAGERTFEQSIDGRTLRYHGPDQIGAGLDWGRHVTISRGIWPLLGHNFRFFSMHSNPQRHIQGGTLMNANEVLAYSVGVAMREDPAAPVLPVISGTQWAGDISPVWAGEIQCVAASGHTLLEAGVVRRYTNKGWEDTIQHYDTGQLKTPRRFAIHLERLNDRYRVSGSVAGIAKQYGWMLEIEAMDNFNTFVEMTFVLDPIGEQLCGYRRWIRDSVLMQVDTIQLAPLKA